MEVISEERKIAVEGEDFIVTHIRTEKYDASEYLRAIDRLKQQDEIADKQKEEIKKILEQLTVQEAAANLVVENNRKKAIKEREEAMKKEASNA